MGLRRGIGRDGVKTGLQIDCMACHGGSIGGKSYVGLGNTQLDLRPLLNELTIADGRRPPPSTFVLNTSRGTNNAGMVAAVLLSLRNPDMSFRYFPVPLGVNLPEMDTPAWWHLKRKRTMYYDGRTDARSVRTNMQFLMGEKTSEQFKELEPAFRDVQAFLLQPRAAPISLPDRRGEGGAWRARLPGDVRPMPRDLRPRGQVSQQDHPAGRDRHGSGAGEWPLRPARGALQPILAGRGAPGEGGRVGYQAPPLDGLWATAPYLHNGSVPTLHALLESSSRPARFTRPPSTGFEHYDTAHVGWKFPEVSAEELASTSRRSPFQAKFIVDTARFGMGNSGHTFGDSLSEDQRMDLIEYLKTL